MKTQFEFRRVQLPNGVTLLFHRNSKAAIVSLNAFANVGKDQNSLACPGCASMTARLLDEGTENYTSEQISVLIENAGIELSTYSERESTSLSFRLRSPDFPMAMELLAEMLIRPVFPEEQFENERKKVLNHVRAMEDDLETVGSQLVNSKVYESSPLGFPLLGVPESLLSLKTSDLKLFHREKIGPAGIVLVISGDVEAALAEDLLVKFFGDWSNPDLSLTKLPPFTRQNQPALIEKRADKEQLSISLGHLGVTRDNPDFYPLQVMDIILGEGPGFISHIPARLREEEGIAYNAYSDIAGSSGLYPGRFVAYVSTAPENRKLAVQLLLETIEELQEEGVSDREVEAAKNFLTGSFAFEFESNASIARYLYTCESFGLGQDFHLRYADLIGVVDASEVQRVARKYLDTVNYTTVVVGSF